MALIGNNADTLLNGLSAFWHRFFRDIGDLQTTYEGTEILLGQVYLNFLSDVLNTSLVETPLFRKEYYKLITLREDQLIFKEHGDNLPTPPVPEFYGNPGFDRYVYTSDTFFGGIPQLQDVILSPKAALNEGVDYRVVGGEIQFQGDPTDPPLPGFANRQVTIGIGGTFTSTSVLDWIGAGVEKGDTLYYSESIDLGIGTPTASQTNARSATVVQVTTGNIAVSSDTAFPTFPTGAAPSGFSWRVMRIRDDGQYNPSLPRSPSGPAPFTDGQIVYTKTLQVNEVSLWAVDAKVDDLSIYNTYGYFFTDPQLSSETYRSLIRGLMQLYILGPAIARLESALNLTAGLPTIRTDGEVLESYDNGILTSGTTGTLTAGNLFNVPTPLFNPSSVGSYIRITTSTHANNIGTFNIIAYVNPVQVELKPITTFTFDVTDMLTWAFTQNNQQVVTTDKDTYIFPLNTPMRTDVTDPANNGVLTFESFEILTTALVVTDYLSDPEWWHEITIPQELLPNLPSARRVVTPQLFPNVLGPIGDAYIGDPGFYIGQDEDNNTTGSAYRHKAAFILMDRFMKLHMFAVLVDSSVTLTGILVSDLQKIMKDVKPVHTALYFRPLTTFHDVIDLTDDLTVTPFLRRVEQVDQVNNQLTIGTTWNIGDTWKFAGAVGGSILLNGGAGYIYAVIGGADPSIQPADPGSPPGSPPDVRWIDRPLYVYMHV